MKGVTTIQLSQADAIAAFQLWADATFKNPPKVSKVSKCDGNGRTTSYSGSGYDSFEITFDAEVDAPKTT